MKKKSTSQSTFSDMGVFTGLLAVVGGLFLLVGALSPNASARVGSNSGFAQGNAPVLVAQKVTASDGTTNSYFGSADALNGPTALIGADGENNFQGAAYLFTKSNDLWSQGQKLTASDGLPGDEFGYRVALADETLVVGAFTATVNGNTSQGAAYVFAKSNNIWSESQKLTANDGALFDNFGAAVSLDGATLVVAANGATVGGNPAQGAVYVFTASNGTWTQTQKLTANDGAAYDNFGLSVVLQGSTILVGSPHATVGTNQVQGAAYVFTQSNGVWTQTQKLTASDGAANDSFGQSVAMSGSTALVGAYNATVNGHSGQGATYVFTNSNSNWNQTQKLTASDGAANANFGNAVALDSTQALIGADVSTVGNNTSQGKAYLFEQSNGNWTQSATLVASDGATDDFFGAAVTLDGPTLLVSTPHPTIGGNTYQGAAYFYNQRTTPSPRSRPTPAPRPTPR
jgi:predicted neuraminidase